MYIYIYAYNICTNTHTVLFNVYMKLDQLGDKWQDGKDGGYSLHYDTQLPWTYGTQLALTCTTTGL